MNRNFKVEKTDKEFVKVFWKFKNTINRNSVWSEIVDSPLINDLWQPIGLLKDFEISSSENKFEQTLIFLVFKYYDIDKFKDIEIVSFDNGKFEFKMI